MTDDEDTASRFRGKRVAVTGCCGTVGLELLNQLQTMSVDTVVGIDHHEGGLFFLEMNFRDDPRFHFHLANVRDIDSMRHRLRNVDIVLHAAALKHVPLCEQSPLEAIQTNINGTQNVIQASRDSGVERLLFTSTDKAVNPTNVMGTSKLMAERLVTAAAPGSDMTVATTRFGNVLGSSGSVLPIFRQQIAKGGPVTVTDPEMTRFIMTLSQATSLVLRSVFLAGTGDVMITKMPIVKIQDLATVLIEELAPRFGHKSQDIQVEIIGPRPGEKRYEELMNEEEVRRAFDIGDFLVVRPALAAPTSEPDGVEARPDRPYNSDHETALTKSELRTFLHDHNLLEDNVV